jgi:hypothetical protein
MQVANDRSGNIVKRYRTAQGSGKRHNIALIIPLRSIA